MRTRRRAGPLAAAATLGSLISDQIPTAPPRYLAALPLAAATVILLAPAAQESAGGPAQGGGQQGTRGWRAAVDWAVVAGPGWAGVASAPWGSLTCSQASWCPSLGPGDSCWLLGRPVRDRCAPTSAPSGVDTARTYRLGRVVVGRGHGRRIHLWVGCLTQPSRAAAPRLDAASFWAVCSARVTQHGPQREGWPAVASHIE